MDLQRNFFIFAFLCVSFLLWQEWQKEKISELQKNRTEIQRNHLFKYVNKNKKYIHIKTDVLDLRINMKGGDIEEANLVKYKSKLNSLQPFRLLETKSNFFYQAQSGLTGEDGLDDLNNNIRPLYISDKSFFKLRKNQKELNVPLTYKSKDGITYIKTFSFRPGEYDIGVKYYIKNNTEKVLKVSMFGQLKQTKTLPKERNSDNNFALQTYRGAAYSTDQKKYEKYKFNLISNNKNLYVVTNSGWIAMLQQYFATAWIPKNFGENIFYTESLNDNSVVVGYKTKTIFINPFSEHIIKSKLWVGPEIQKKMSLVASNLDLTVDYGWLWFLSQPLFKILSILHKFTNNWGWSIVAITFIVRAVLFPLTKAQYVSMAKIRVLQPKINNLKLKYKNNKQRMSQEIMSLYKTQKVNPLGGCFPLLIQMPIFLALYYMLIGSVELRHAPFLLWIKDLSSQDPYYILPILMGFTMFFIQKTSPNNITDPMQKKIMNFMPVVFTTFFLWFPSGLVLYYTVSNLVTIIQQQFVFHNLNKKELY